MNMKIRSTWRPVVLYWRRRRQPRPQVHLHFATHVEGSQQRPFVTRILRTTRIIERQRFVRDRIQSRIVTHHNNTSQITLRTTTATFSGCNPLPLRIYAADASRQKSLLKTATTRAFYVNKSTSHQTTHDQKFFASTIKLQTRHEQVSLSRTILQSREVASLPPHSAQRESLVFPSSPNKTSRQFQFGNSEELVWRRKPQHATAIEDSPIANTKEAASRQSLHTNTAATDAPSAAQQSNQTTPQQLTKLDPGLLDRLAEDVIRRVEKRARIERDRRGL
jgi:hypothetical protein